MVEVLATGVGMGVRGHSVVVGTASTSMGNSRDPVLGSDSVGGVDMTEEGSLRGVSYADVGGESSDQEDGITGARGLYRARARLIRRA